MLSSHSNRPMRWVCHLVLSVCLRRHLLKNSSCSPVLTKHSVLGSVDLFLLPVCLESAGAFMSHVGFIPLFYNHNRPWCSLRRSKAHFTWISYEFISIFETFFHIAFPYSISPTPLPHPPPPTPPSTLPKAHLVSENGSSIQNNELPGFFVSIHFFAL